MKIECKNCGHWLVEVYCPEKPTPHLKCTCRRCGAVWVEKENNLFTDREEAWQPFPEKILPEPAACF